MQSQQQTSPARVSIHTAESEPRLHESFAVFSGPMLSAHLHRHTIEKTCVQPSNLRNLRSTHLSGAKRHYFVHYLDCRCCLAYLNLRVSHLCAIAEPTGKPCYSQDSLHIQREVLFTLAERATQSDRRPLDARGIQQQYRRWRRTCSCR